MKWRKAKRSSANGGACIELAAIENGVAVRDSKNMGGPVFRFGRDAFAAFTADIKNGKFNQGR